MPSGVYRCADGYIQVSTLVTWYSRVFRVIGKPEWITDERITSNLNDPEVIGAEVEAAFLAWLRPLTKQQAMEEAQAQGWPLSALNTPADVMRDPHMRERGFFVTVDHPEAGSVELPGLALRFYRHARGAAPPAAAGGAQRRDLRQARLHAAGSRRAAHPERDLAAVEGQAR